MTSFWELTHDQRAELARNKPEKFDSLAEKEQQMLFLKNEKLQKTQWIISGELRRIKNPVERMNRAGAIMMEKLQELNTSLKPFGRK